MLPEEACIEDEVKGGRFAEKLDTDEVGIPPVSLIFKVSKLTDSA